MTDTAPEGWMERLEAEIADALHWGANAVAVDPADLQSALAETARLREALGPFAAFAEAIPHMGATFPKAGDLYTIFPAATGERALTVEHFKAAESALSPPQGRET